MEQRVRERAEGGEKSNVEIVKLDNFSVPVALFLILPCCPFSLYCLLLFRSIFVFLFVSLCMCVWQRSLFPIANTLQIL